MTAGATTTLSAIIVSFSDPEATRGAVESLLAQSHPPIEVLVVDNHPDARTANAMGAWPPDARVRLVHSGENLGYTGGCNVAAAQARGELAVLPESGRPRRSGLSRDAP